MWEQKSRKKNMGTKVSKNMGKKSRNKNVKN
jgi:hypothetical protein